MGQVAWQKSKAEMAATLDAAGAATAASRGRVRDVLQRFGAWARTDSGPKGYVSQAGRLVMRTTDAGTIIPLSDKEAEVVDGALIDLYVRSEAQYYMVAAHVIGGFDLATLASRYRRPQSRIRELVNAGLDYLDGVLPEI